MILITTIMTFCFETESKQTLVMLYFHLILYIIVVILIHILHMVYAIQLKYKLNVLFKTYIYIYLGNR